MKTLRNQIPNCAFQDCDTLETVTLPATITRIGSGAFYGCSELPELDIPDSVQEIGDFAFAYAGLIKIALPESLTTIQNDTFSYCKFLRKVTVPRSVTWIGDNAFWGCLLLREIVFRHGANDPLEMSSNAFAHSDKYGDNLRTTIKLPLVDNPNLSITGRDWPIWNRTIIWLSYCEHYESSEPARLPTCTEEGMSSVVSCETCGAILEASKVIPPLGHDPDEDSICRRCEELVILNAGSCGANVRYQMLTNGNLIISGSGAMESYGYNKKVPWESWRGDIKKVIFEEGVTAVGNSAFCNCENLGSVELCGSIVSIGAEAFRNNKALTQIVISASVSQIGNQAFDGCMVLSGIWVSENNKVYSNDPHGVLFSKEKDVLIQAPGNMTGEYQIPDTVVSISDNAFLSNRGLSVTIPLSRQF